MPMRVKMCTEPFSIYEITSNGRGLKKDTRNFWLVWIFGPYPFVILKISHQDRSNPNVKTDILQRFIELRPKIAPLSCNSQNRMFLPFLNKSLNNVRILPSNETKRSHFIK